METRRIWERIFGFHRKSFVKWNIKELDEKRHGIIIVADQRLEVAEVFTLEDQGNLTVAFQHLESWEPTETEKFKLFDALRTYIKALIP